MLAGEVKQSERNIVSEYGVESFPTLLIVSPEHGTVKFEGKLNRDNLKAFMEKYALPSDKKTPPPPPPPSQKKATEAPKKKAKQGMKSNCAMYCRWF